MTKPVATVYIPYAPHHTETRLAAIASAERQTVSCKVISSLSPNTPATFRNTARFADTDFVVFLDADDTMQPTFIEDCLRVYQQGCYVYTGWNEGERRMMPRESSPYLAHDFEDERGLVGGYHLVTTLFPTELFKVLGGFDETLQGMEDTDFYMRSNARGVCGVLCPKPLLNYNTDVETRSKRFRTLTEYEVIRRSVFERNGGIEKMACNCVSSGGSGANLQGAQPGDVTVEILQPGAQMGTASGRYYERPMFVGQRRLVDPRDADAMQGVYRRVENLQELAPTRERALRESGLI